MEMNVFEIDGSFLTYQGTDKFLKIGTSFNKYKEEKTLNIEIALSGILDFGTEDETYYDLSFHEFKEIKKGEDEKILKLIEGVISLSGLQGLSFSNINKEIILQYINEMYLNYNI